jgi:hypothetical protein
VNKNSLLFFTRTSPYLCDPAEMAGNLDKQRNFVVETLNGSFLS